MRKWIIYILYSLMFLLIPVFHWGLEYIYTKFFIWSLFFFLIVLLSDELPVPSKKSAILFLPFIISLFSSVFLSDHPLWGYHVTMLIFLFLLFPQFFYHHFRNSGKINILLLILLIVPLFIVEIIGILQFHKILPLPIDRYGRPDPGSLVGLSNFASHYIVIILPSIIYLIFREIKDKKVSISLAIVTLALSLYYLVIALNRASLVALISLFLLWIILRFRNEWKEISLVITLSILFLHITGKLNMAYRRILSSFDLSDPAIGYRLHLWKSSLNAISDKPLGMGMGDYRFEIWKYIDYYLKKMSVTGDIIIQHAHNEYIEAALEGSLLLLIAIFIVILLSILKSKTEEKFTIFSTTSAMVVSFFSFPMHMPLSLFISSLFITGKEHFHNMFSWRKNRFYRAFLSIIILFYLIFLLNISIAEYHSRKGINLIIKKSYDRCEKEFTEAISHFKEEPDYFYNRAVCRENLKLTQGAIRDLKESIRLSPYQPQPYKFLGVLFLKEGKKKEGIKWLKKYLQIIEKPIEIQPIHFIIAASLDLGDNATAEKYLKIAEKTFPSNKIILMDKMALLISKGKYEEAIKLSHSLERIFHTLPPEYYMLKAQLLVNLNKSPLPALKMLVDKNPDPRFIIPYLLEIKKEKGEQSALKEMEEILKKNPSLLNYLLQDREIRGIFQRGEKR